MKKLTPAQLDVLRKMAICARIEVNGIARRVPCRLVYKDLVSIPVRLSDVTRIVDDPRGLVAPRRARFGFQKFVITPAGRAAVEEQ